MKTIKGWRKISSQGSYLNETTEQSLIVSKKKFSENYQVILFAGAQTSKTEEKVVSPEFATEAKAQAFVLDLMAKHPNGIPGR